MPPITAVHHLSLTVTDLDASARWYREVFGLQQMMEETHHGGRALVFMQPETGVFIGLHAHDSNDGKPFAEARTGLDHVSFTVGSRDDLAAWEKTLRDRGAVVSPISDQPWGSVLVFRDPDNIQLELCAPPAA
jgi:glyoxylase I family protein